jgi:hypothetical protein
LSAPEKSWAFFCFQPLEENRHEKHKKAQKIQALKKRGTISIPKNGKRPSSENLQFLLLCIFVFFVAINPSAKP